MRQLPARLHTPPLNINPLNQNNKGLNTMATRSRIGLKTTKGIKHIYAHWDGYPDYVGKILLEHYNTQEKINELLNVGNVSCLKPLIGEKHDFDNANPEWSVFYGRDRDDKGEEARNTNNVTNFLKSVSDCWGEYAYLFRDNQWFYQDMHSANGFLPLADYFNVQAA